MTKIVCDYDAMEANHPNQDTIKHKAVGGAAGDLIKSGVETCCIELSYALNNCGQSIGQNYAYPSPEIYRGKVRAAMGGDGNTYIYAVPDMKVFLDGKYKCTENYKGVGKAALTKNIRGRKGVIALGYRHIDLWDGSNYHLNRTGYVIDLWSNESTVRRGIFFWEIQSLDSYLQEQYGR